jgi:hypothetical protein
MPVAQGINGTILESQQTKDQRVAFNANNLDGQRGSIKDIFSSSPIHSLSDTLSADDRSNLFDADANAIDNVDAIKKAYANLLTGTVNNGFGFNSSVDLSMDEDYFISNEGIVTPEGYNTVNAKSDKPQVGTPNLFTKGNLNNPSEAAILARSGSRNNNFGVNIPNPNADTLGQFFNNTVNGE